MKNLIAIFILTFFSGRIGAATVYQGVDISPVIEYYDKKVFVLNQSITMYNWSKRDGSWEKWFKTLLKKEPTQNDPRFLNHIREWASVFWKEFGHWGQGNLYGFGLYLASDPAVTRSYGGHHGLWRLIQIQFPVGTRILDFAAGEDLPQDSLEEFYRIVKIQSIFNCPNTTDPERFFSGGGSDISKSCQGFVREIFEKHLKVDALAYGYDTHLYPACSFNQLIQNHALVLVSGDRVTSENLHVYNADSRLNRMERIRIETLVSGDSDDGLLHEDSRYGMLWPDLDGEERSPGIDRWLMANKAGCNGKLPYAEPKVSTKP